MVLWGIDLAAQESLLKATVAGLIAATAQHRIRHIRHGFRSRMAAGQYYLWPALRGVPASSGRHFCGWSTGVNSDLLVRKVNGWLSVVSARTAGVA
jgi:hypothetical protein